MEVTKENFEEVLGDLQEVIEQCDFLAYDLEMSGVNEVRLNSNSAEEKLLGFLTAEYNYYLTRGAAHSYRILQFGLCAFRRAGETETHGDLYTSKAFNFYLFQDSAASKMSGRGSQLVFSVSSAEFLRNNSFQFDKVFHGGISYLRSGDEEAYLKKFTERRKVESSKPDLEIREEDEEFIREIREKMLKLAEEGKPGDMEELGLWYSLGWRNRQFLYQLAREYNTISIRKIGEERGDVFYAKRIPECSTEVEKKALEVKEWIGFRNVLDIIWEAKKPIVGHNCFTDFCFLYDAFIGNLMESDYETFKKNVHERFPQIVDTKKLAEHFPIQRTPLQMMYEYVQSERFYKICELPKGHTDFPLDVECEDYVSNDGQYHDAAFDAYMTGYVFLRLRKAFEIWKRTEWFEEDINRICIYGCAQSLTLGKDESMKDYSFYLHVDGFPKSMTAKDVQNIISSANAKNLVRVKWINDNSLMFIWEENAPGFEEFAKAMAAREEWTVKPLSKEVLQAYVALLPEGNPMRGGQKPNGEPSRKRKRTDSAPASVTT